MSNTSLIFYLYNPEAVKELLDEIVLFIIESGAAQVGDLDTGVARVQAAIELHPNWRELLSKLPPEVAPSAAPVLARLAKEKGIDMPIVDAVDALIAGRANVDQVLGALLSRPPRSEVA